MVQGMNGSGKSGVAQAPRQMSAAGCMGGLVVAGLVMAIYIALVFVVGWVWLTVCGTLGWRDGGWSWTEQFAVGVAFSLLLGLSARRAK